MKRKLFENVGGNKFKLVENEDPTLPGEAYNFSVDTEQGGGEIFIERLMVGGGQLVDATVFVSGEMEEDSFDYERGMEKGTHVRGHYFEVDSFTIRKIVSSEGNQDLTQDKNARDYVEDFCEIHKKEIADRLTEEYNTN